jgi:hypothetical protein
MLCGLTCLDECLRYQTIWSESSVLQRANSSMPLKDPIKQILISSRDIWDRASSRPDVRENFRKTIECRTEALGWDLYAAE